MEDPLARTQSHSHTHTHTPTHPHTHTHTHTHTQLYNEWCKYWISTLLIPLWWMSAIGCSIWDSSPTCVRFSNTYHVRGKRSEECGREICKYSSSRLLLYLAYNVWYFSTLFPLASIFTYLSPPTKLDRTICTSLQKCKSQSATVTPSNRYLLHLPPITYF